MTTTARIRSLQSTAVAYDGGMNAKHEGFKHKVTLSPGVNDLTRDDVKLLDMDDKFASHFKAGFYVEMDEPPRNAEGLRTDGPTLREYQTAGCHPDAYPPAGYAAVAEARVEQVAAENIVPPAADGEAVDPRAKLENEDTETYALRLDAWQKERGAKKPGESAAKYKARMAAYDADDDKFFAVPADELDADQKAFVEDFYAMTQEEQDALRPTLSAEEVALLEANKPASKPEGNE